MQTIFLVIYQYRSFCYEYFTSVHLLLCDETYVNYIMLLCLKRRWRY